MLIADRYGPSMVMTSPFAQWERDAGASVVERFGVELPDHYGDAESEYGAARTGAGLVDLSFRGMLRVAGGERLRWLNGQISNEVKALKAGEGRRAAVLTAKGHLVADLVVYGLEDSVRIDLQRDRAQAVAGVFERHIIADDVQVEDVSERCARLALVGPEAERVLAGAVGAEIGDLPPWHHREVRLGAVPVRIAASRRLARDGVDVIAPIEAAGRLWEALRQAGRDAGLRPVGMRALEWLRVEAGWPWFGVDFDETNLLTESLASDHVSLTKGCYIGQEVVIRIEHQGHLNKKLCGLALEGATMPARGATISRGDRAVGYVTSAVLSPALGRVIALGYLRRECWEPGTRVRIDADPEPAEAVSAALPFVAA
jgi:folate-binding protein YgfZ